MSTKNNIHKIKYYRHSSISNPVHNEEIGQDIKIHRLTVEFRNIPLGMSNENNAREAKLNKAFHKEMKNSLVNSEYSDFTPGLFNLRNSGIVIVAESAHVSEDNSLVINLGEKGSIIDGGHTYKIISSIIEDYNNHQIDSIPEEYVQIEVIVGLNKNLQGEITEARNTSQKHLVMSFESQKGNFEWIKQALNGKPGLPDFSEKIAWYQNAGAEDGISYPIDAAYIIKVLTTCDIINYPDMPFIDMKAAKGKAHPILSYNSKEKAVLRHRDKKEDYVAMKDIALDICRLHDLILADSPNWWNGQNQVQKIWDSKKTNYERIVFVLEPMKQQVRLAPKTLADPFAYPMLASLRCMLEVVDTVDGRKIAWKQGYSYEIAAQMLSDGLGYSLLLLAYSSMDGSGNMSMNHICKDYKIWLDMYEVAKNFIENYKK